MKLRIRARICISAVVALLSPLAPTQDSPMRHWELNLAATDADLSPDDRLLAVTIETRGSLQKSHKQVVESVELWDYRENRKVLGTQLGSYPKPAATPNAVRFTADGALLVASGPTRIHVLDPSTLSSLRIIDPPLRPDSYISHIETAPAGHIAAVVANRDGPGVLFAYDLDTGQLLYQSDLWVVTSIAWRPDASQIAVATPHLCNHTRNTVQVFGTNPWSHLRTLHARNPTSVAFSAERLYVVESGFCDGSLFDRHLGLESFDVRTWHRERTIFLEHNNVHDSVSFANGRLLADSGELKTVHDWSDGTTTGFALDTRATIWESDSSSVEFTSHPLATGSQRGVSGWRLRLSRTGKMVILAARHPEVFEIP